MNEYEEEVLRVAVDMAVKERGPKDTLDNIVNCVIVFMEDWTGNRFWSEDRVRRLVNEELKKV